jgi:hypothetical protein
MGRLQVIVSSCTSGLFTEDSLEQKNVRLRLVDFVVLPP